MNQFNTVKVNLPLKKTFAVSGGSATVKTNVLTVLNNRYFGEAAASVKYGPDLNALEQDIRKGIELLTAFERLDISTLHEIKNFDIHPVAKSALCGMILNYLSGEANRYPWEVLSLPSPLGIRNSLTIGIDSPESMLEAIRTTEYPIIKVKMGGPDDVKILEGFKEVEGKEIRVDANAGWQPAQAEEMIFFLSKAGVKVVEQPTAPEHVKDWPHIKGKSEVQLIMDEGMNSIEDYKRVGEAVDGINVKMEKTGGIIEAIKLAQQARKDGKKVMLGCMVESSIGIAQSVYMSSLADYYDLDGPNLLEHDIAKGIVYQGDTIQVDREIIGGPQIIRDVVEKYSS